MNPTPFPPAASLLPHAGAMVMPEAILHFDHQRLVCTTTRHRAADNPLRRDGRLPALAGIEFAAQAMALHGALRQTPPRALTNGRLGGVRDIVLHRAFLDDIDDALQIECRLDGESGDVFAYLFSIAAAARPILDGRATVMMSI